MAVDVNLTLRPATPHAIQKSLSFALRYAGRKRGLHADPARHQVSLLERKKLERFPQDRRILSALQLRYPSRREVMAALAGSLLPMKLALAGPSEAIAALEREQGGRLGLYASDAGSGRCLAYREDERFLLCSTFKLLLAAAILARVDAGQEQLDRRMSFTAADLLSYAPVTRAHLAQGSLTIGELCQAAVEVSDNTAANLLLAAIGGPAAVTRFARGLGDGVTRLDRIELALNVPDGVLDTTTPRAMAESARAVLLGPALEPGSRAVLEGWMVAGATGRHRLRAGLPSAWPVGDKTGTGDTQTNDLAIIRPPGRSPVIVAAYYEGGPSTIGGREAMLRQVGSVVASWAA